MSMLICTHIWMHLCKAKYEGKSLRSHAFIIYVLMCAYSHVCETYAYVCM